jgi:hypothetical protein
MIEYSGNTLQQCVSVFLCAHPLPYLRPQVAGTLLKNEKERVAEQIMDKRDIAANKYGVSIVSDGATDIKKEPILNLLEVYNGLLHFVCAKDCTGKVKDMNYIAFFISEYIWKLDNPFSVCQVRDFSLR